MSKFPEFESFTALIDVDGLDAVGRSYDLTASGDDLQAAATFLHAIEARELSADGTVSRHGSMVRILGTVRATLIRECVATLEPMEEKIDQPFDVSYTTEAVEPEIRDEVQADLEAPEPIDGPSLELSHILLEQVVLAMSAHPRREGADAIADPGAGARITPFDVLKEWKDRN